MTDEAVSGTTLQGRRLFDDPKLDQVVQMIVALAGELSTSLLTLDTLIRLLASKGFVTRQELTAYVPNPEAHAERAEILRVLVHNVMHGLEADIQGRDQNSLTGKSS